MLELKSDTSAGPFQTSAPEFDFWSALHFIASERLAFAIDSAVLLAVFTGEPGVGKSTVVRKVLSENQSPRLIGVCEFGPLMSTEPCRAVLEAFAIDPEGGDEEARKRILQKSLAAARRANELPILILDDAHRLETPQIKKLFDLARFNGEPEEALFKIILIGNPELADRLEREMGDLPGPVFTLEPMPRNDTVEYVRHRLKVADFDHQLFDDAALRAIHRRTGGIPEKINLLCQAILEATPAPAMAKIGAKSVLDCKVASLPDIGIEEMAAEFESTDTAPSKAQRANVKTRRPRGKRVFANDFSNSLNSPGPTALEIGFARLKMDPEPPGDFAPEPALAPAEEPAEEPAQETVAKQADEPVEEPVAIPADEPADEIEIVENPNHSRFGAVISGAGIVGVAALALFLTAQNPPPDEPGAIAGDETTAPGPELSVSVSKLVAPSVDAERDTGVQHSQTQTQTAPNPQIIEAVKRSLNMADFGSIRAILDSTADPAEEATALYRLGLSVAADNPKAAAVAYALAADGGHARAAYFLGQIYELGEGVPVDIALARNWYERAGDKIEGAAQRLTTLASHRPEGTPVAPLQLFSTYRDNSEVLLVWTSGTGSDPLAYTVEFSDADGKLLEQVSDIQSSVLRHRAPEAAVFWRVRAQSDASADGTATDWLYLEAGKMPASP